MNNKKCSFDDVFSGSPGGSGGSNNSTPQSSKGKSDPERSPDSIGSSHNKRRLANLGDFSKISTENNSSCSISISSILFFLIVFLNSCMVIVGIFGITFFLSSSFETVDVQRTSSFVIVKNKFTNILRGPKLVTDAMQAVLPSGLVDFETTDYEKMNNFTFMGMKNNFDRLGLKSMIIFLSNSGSNRFVSFWRHYNQNRTSMFFRRYNEFENTTELKIGFCSVHPDSGECTTPIVYVPWNEEASITTQSKYIYTHTWVPPYLFFCPGPMCDIFFAYTRPFHKDGKYVGTLGFAFESLTLRNALKEATGGLFGAFVFDLTTGFMISASDPEIITFYQENGMAFQVKAADHPKLTVKSLTKYVLSLHNNSHTKIVGEKRYSSSYGNYLIDYFRYNIDGADYMVVVYYEALNFYQYSIYFGVSFFIVLIFGIISSMSVGVCVTCCIGKPINDFIAEMDQAEQLNFEKTEISITNIKELDHLKRKFSKMCKTLAVYTAFVPQYVRSGSKKVVEGKKMKLKYSSSSEEVCSSTSECTMSIGSSSKLKFFSALSLGYKKKYVTIAHIKWDHHICEFDNLFIDNHSYLSKIIQSRLNSGNIIKFNHNGFFLAFNLFKEVEEHSVVALSFVSSLQKKLEEEGFETYSSVVTGFVDFAILGSVNMKTNDIFGENVKFCKELSNHAFCMKEKILINERCFEHVGLSFECAPVDLVFDSNCGDEANFVFNAKKMKEVYDNEWMYKNEEKEKMLFRRAKIRNFCKYLRSNDLKNCVKSIKKNKMFQKYWKDFVGELVKKEVNLTNRLKEVISRKNNLQKCMQTMSILKVSVRKELWGKNCPNVESEVKNGLSNNSCHVESPMTLKNIKVDENL